MLPGFGTIGACFLFWVTLCVPALAAGPVQYSITSLKPEKSSRYAVEGRAAQREYFHFRNGQGSHRFIYQEASGKPPLMGISNIREVMGSTDSVCRVDLECREQAFCAG